MIEEKLAIPHQFFRFAAYDASSLAALVELLYLVSELGRQSALTKF
jgi:hypothetical protein